MEFTDKKLLRTIGGHTAIVMSVAFSPDGRLLASGSNDMSIKLWQSHTLKLIHTLSGHSGGIRSVAFSLDGKLLASGSSDATVKALASSYR